MLGYIWSGGIVAFVVILVMLTIFATRDIIKKDMTAGDGIFDFIDYFKTEYEGLYIVWASVFMMLIIIFMFMGSLLL